MYKSYNGFKLISLTLKDNPLFGGDELCFNFLEDNDVQDAIYTTVLIGVNGTGKSNLFRTLIELFKELNDLKNGKNRTYNVNGQFSLKYTINDHVYEYSNIRNVSKTKHANASDGKLYAYILRNDTLINFEHVELPETIVANSIMLTDKYPVYNNENVFPNYNYLGIRNRPQSASTRSYVRKTVEFIVQEFDSEIFRRGLYRATKFLSLGNSIEILYYTSNTSRFFKGNLTPEKLDEYFYAIQEKYKDSDVTPPYKLQSYLRLKQDERLVNKICSFCNELVSKDRLLKIERSSAKKISYNILNEESFTELRDDFVMLEYLRPLGLVHAPEIHLNRGEGYSLQESSSGEYHFFSSVVGLMATVKPNGLVFIDEPEVSLHPNWQLMYLSFIRDLFAGEDYAKSHIVIATHSHFLISDLIAKNSKIIGLKREDGRIKIAGLPENLDTYCWSADDILYNIFNVTSSRNKFVAEEISKILSTLSKSSQDINIIDKNAFNTLLRLQDTLKENDPLKEVVKAILKKVQA